MSKRMGADLVLDHTKMDVIAEIRRLTHGVGVDVAIEAFGTQSTFENALRVLRAGGTLSSLGVYSGKLSVPLEPFAAGLSAITKSLRRFARAEKNGCAGSWNWCVTADLIYDLF
jgi:threonine dehydrogenase-like Zn-dependent dehydrogenase